MLTRRHAVMLGLGLPAWASPAGEFWNVKKPEDWTPEEIDQLTIRSPWAKDGSISVNSGPGGASRNRNPRIGVQVPGAAPNGPQYRATVRWESALPIRLATKSKPAGDFYIIALLGDVPNMMRSDDDESQHETQVEMLKRYTKLEKGRDFIPLSNAEGTGKGKSAGTLFYFDRTDAIKASDNQITFVTKLGPIEVKAKFTLKEMMYQGKLEL